MRDANVGVLVASILKLTLTRSALCQMTMQPQDNGLAYRSRLEMVEIKTKPRQSFATPYVSKRFQSVLTEFRVIQQIGESIMVGHMRDAKLRLPPVGDVFVNSDGVAVQERLVGNRNDAPVAEIARFVPRLSSPPGRS